MRAVRGSLTEYNSGKTPNNTLQRSRKSNKT